MRILNAYPNDLRTGRRIIELAHLNPARVLATRVRIYENHVTYQEVQLNPDGTPRIDWTIPGLVTKQRVIRNPLPRSHK